MPKLSDECVALWPYRVILKNSRVISESFQNVEVDLRICLSLMVTNCTGERSFSVLKIRLADLGRLAIESEIAKSLDVDNIIQDFANAKARKVTVLNFSWTVFCVFCV